MIGEGPYRNSRLYESSVTYDATTTCNTWTGDALRRAGVPVSPWTPFAGNVTWHLAPLPPSTGPSSPPPRG